MEKWTHFHFCGIAFNDTTVGLRSNVKKEQYQNSTYVFRSYKNIVVQNNTAHGNLKIWLHFLFLFNSHGVFKKEDQLLFILYSNAKFFKDLSLKVEDQYPFRENVCWMKKKRLSRQQKGRKRLI